METVKRHVHRGAAVIPELHLTMMEAGELLGDVRGSCRSRGLQALIGSLGKVGAPYGGLGGESSLIFRELESST